jgi:peptidoglycan/LPS O-acetylase OafA/YrhL
MGWAGSGRTVSQAGERRFTRIESLRAIAALGVVAGHIILVAGRGTDDGLIYRVLFGGGLGVYFFFGLTGYLLFWPFAQRWFGDRDPIDLRHYAVNRALRILPLYFVVVIVVLAFADDTSLGVWARFLTFTETTSNLTAGQYVDVAWSLAVELMFYALLPLLAWAIARLSGRSIARAAAVLLALAALSYICRIVKVYDGHPAEPIWRFNLPSTFVFFVPGMLLALTRLEWERRAPGDGWWSDGQLWFAISLALWVPVLLISYHLDLLIGAAAFLAIGACVLPLRDGPLLRLLDWGPLVAIGVASYSLYLWHLPIERSLYDGLGAPSPAALALVAVPAAIAAALLSYRFIESPFLRLRRQWSRAAAPKVQER